MKTRIGYSCWGFLGHGIVDTPDGGRSHRAYLVRTLIAEDFEVVMLQRDRDLLEAGDRIAIGQTWDAGFPPIDLLFLEWRWMIPGRNDHPGVDGYTPDWHRQRDLIRAYSGRVPIVIWDKDQEFAAGQDDLTALLRKGTTYVFEASLAPSEPRRIRALFPFDRAMVDSRLSLPHGRRMSLVYVGNDYNRREDFETYLATAAGHIDTHVFGKWPERIGDGKINYYGRVGYLDVPSIYRESVATPILAPMKYKRTGQYTQRVFEAVAKGCLPLFPADYKEAHNVGEPCLIVSSGADVCDRVSWLRTLSGAEFRHLLASQVERLSPFCAHALLERIREVLLGRATPYFSTPRRTTS